MNRKADFILKAKNPTAVKHILFIFETLGTDFMF